MRAALVAFAVLRFGLKLELGPEYDSNANRAETIGDKAAGAALPIPSFLLRTTAFGSLRWTAGPSTLRASADLGGKLFFAGPAMPEDVAVAQGALDEQLRLGRHLVLGAGGDYYDAIQPRDCPPARFGNGDQQLSPSVGDTSCHRDFRAGGGRGQVALLLGDVDLSLGLGGRAFRWKPDDELSFDGASASAALGLHLRSGEVDDEAEWDLLASARAELRDYHGPKLSSASDPGSDAAPRRRDLDAVGTVSLTYVGKLLAGAAYSLDWDRSSSYGQSYLRHLVSLKVAADLGWKLVATFKAQLTFTGYAQPAAITTGALVAVTIEDESRDAFIVDLERPLGGGASLSARYSAYRNGVSNATLDYLRQVVYLGLSYRLR